MLFHTRSSEEVPEPTEQDMTDLEMLTEAIRVVLSAKAALEVVEEYGFNIPSVAISLEDCNDFLLDDDVKPLVAAIEEESEDVVRGDNVVDFVPARARVVTLED